MSLEYQPCPTAVSSPRFSCISSHSVLPPLSRSLLVLSSAHIATILHMLQQANDAQVTDASAPSLETDLFTNVSEPPCRLSPCSYLQGTMIPVPSLEYILSKLLQLKSGSFRIADAKPAIPSDTPPILSHTHRIGVRLRKRRSVQPDRDTRLRVTHRSSHSSNKVVHAFPKSEAFPYPKLLTGACAALSGKSWSQRGTSALVETSFSQRLLSA